MTARRTASSKWISSGDIEITPANNNAAVHIIGTKDNGLSGWSNIASFLVMKKVALYRPGSARYFTRKSLVILQSAPLIRRCKNLKDGKKLGSPGEKSSLNSYIHTHFYDPASMNSFFTSLPAILGVVAFVIYQILKKSVADDPIVKSALDKIRRELPGTISDYSNLNKNQIERLLKNDQEFRKNISNSELVFIDNALRRRHQTNIFIYSLSGFLLLVGIVLFIYQTNKPRDLFVDNIQIQNTDQKSRYVTVDLDPIVVTWTSTGQDEIVYVALENVETGQQSKKIRVQASEGKIVFKSDRYDNYDKILSNRQPLQSNRIRVIIFAGSESFTSREFEIKVGVRLYCLASLPNRIIFFATIDNITIDNYHFLPKIALFEGPNFTNQKIYAAREFASKHDFIISNPARIDVSNYVLTYTNPDDDRVVRTEVDLTEFIKLRN